MKLYKIRQRSTNLFSSGGYCPRWTKKGKAWESAAHMKSSIRQWVEYQFRYRGAGTYAYGKLENIPVNDLKLFLNDYEIVEYEVTEKGVSEEITDYLKLDIKEPASV